jgi:hypothetical protein
MKYFLIYSARLLFNDIFLPNYTYYIIIRSFECWGAWKKVTTFGNAAVRAMSDLTGTELLVIV